MRQIQFQSFGKPEEQATCGEAPEPTPSTGEVLVRVLTAPINPADINYIEGTYGIKPELPAVPGNEACAEVISCGDGVEGFAPGDQVIFLGRGNLWQDQIALSADQLVKIPAGLDPLQACQLSVNPPTAALLLTDFQDLPKGSWVAQNAANSAVGQAIIQIAKFHGLKTINFVRRESLIPQLEALGADVVFLDEKDSVAKARELAGDGGPSLVFNAVGGESALRLMDLLAPQGQMITYGAMSRQSLKVPNSFLIFKRIVLRGLWVTEWFKEAGTDAVRDLFGELGRLMADGALKLPVEKVYPPEEIAAALTHAQRAERDGKIILRFADQ
ncbi:MAG: trans-2-enoyl-CoA reductase [Verrucomicrobiales bacterium]|jgi:trans-2-enoyl-CoA reductase